MVEIDYLKNWRDLVAPKGEDLLSSPSTAPSRVRTFLFQPQSKSLPYSCALIKYNNDLFETLKLTSSYLRSGAGVKIVLDDFQVRTPVAKFSWSFFLEPEHPDFKYLSPQQKEYLGFEGEWLYVADSMEESNEDNYSIVGSWLKFIELAEAGKNIVVNLSRLRPYGQENANGLMASGPIGMGERAREDSCSFLSIYQALADHLRCGDIGSLLKLLGTLNDTLRRGGFKRGIVTSSMHYGNPNFPAYLNVPINSLPGGHKKGARLTPEVLLNRALVNLIVEKVNTESLFLVKVKPECYDNVCVGIGLRARGTCLIWRVNLGLIPQPKDLPCWFMKATRQLALLHIYWRKENPEKAKLVAPLEKDPQIALDVMGLANALARWKITYQEFVDAISEFNDSTHHFREASDAHILVFYLAKAYQASLLEADSICEEHGLGRLERIHTPAEPAQNHSYETKDLDGYTVTRSIFAPFGRKIRRVSDHQENIVVNHGPVEVASEVGPQLHQRLCEEWTRFVGTVGRSHDYMSFDTWAAIDAAWLEDFLTRSPLWSKYYSEHENYDQYYLKKEATLIARKYECQVCAE